MRLLTLLFFGLFIAACHGVYKYNLYAGFYNHFDPGWIIKEQDYYYKEFLPYFEPNFKFLDEFNLSKIQINEIIYFHRWYVNQTQEIQEKVVNFYKNKRIDFGSGGW